ncbi:serine hydrolase [Cupriavidus gilardii]|uniref:serine hydrolase n=1 Tax=Cupriavidus gilardii TaxID=82541 RepID=UPI0021DB12B2
MTTLHSRRTFLVATLGTALAACGGDDDDPPPSGGEPPPPVPEARIAQAIASLDKLVTDQMSRTGVPGVATAVVRRDPAGNRVVYAKGFGKRAVDEPATVDADTVFQLASMSKSIGAMVVAHQVGVGRIRWDTPVQSQLPWFALSDPEVNPVLTVADLYSHRSGLPDHAGDRLEDMGCDRRQVLERLRFLPLHPFRASYQYTNFGLTAAAEAVATAAATDWATLSEQTLYGPLGMTRTSSRHADYVARDNRAVGHVRENGVWVRGPVRDADAQSPAGGVSASVNDVARWLIMMLGEGMFEGRRIVEAGALKEAIAPHNQSTPPAGGRPAGFYGYGFNVGTNPAGRPMYNHSGAFALGAATAFLAVPSLGLAIVTLTNGYPIGVPETINNQFFDLVDHGAIQQDWATIIEEALAPVLAPEGALVGATPPASPLPPRALSVYAGDYANDYYGPITVRESAGALVLTIGPAPLVLPLSHWDGDVYTFQLRNENATPGTISRVWFGSDRLTLEYYDQEGLGTFLRTS